MLVFIALFIIILEFSIFGNIIDDSCNIASQTPKQLKFLNIVKLNNSYTLDIQL